MYRQFHRVLEAFKITEKKEEVAADIEKDLPKPSKPQEKVQDQFAADEEAAEVIFHLQFNCISYSLKYPSTLILRQQSKQLQIFVKYFSLFITENNVNAFVLDESFWQPD